MSEIGRGSDESSDKIEQAETPPGAFVSDPTHDLFISYRRSDAAFQAVALRRWLRRYRLPKALQTESSARELEIYLDKVNVRAKSDFMEEIVPALGQSRYLLVVHSKDAHKRAPDGGPNWLVRELRVFRSRDNPRRNQIVAATLDGDFDAALPDGLDEDLPRIERLDIRELASWWRWWPPKRLRIESELLPLVDSLLGMKYEDLTTLRREAERAATNRLVTMLSTALATIGVLVIALAWTFISQVDARKANFDLRFAEKETSRVAADALALNAQVARERGNYLGAIRFLAEARSLAWTPQVQATALSLEEPMAVFDHTLEFRAWKTAFSPEGMLALGSFDGEIVLYDPEQKTQITIRQPDDLPVVDLTFEPSGDLLVVLRSPADAAWNRTGQSETASRLERISTSGAIVDLGSPPSEADWLSVSRSKNAEVIVAGADDGVWLRESEIQGWRHLGAGNSGAKPRGPVSVAASSMGDFVAASTIQGEITVWRIVGQQVTNKWLVPRSEGTFSYNPFDLAFQEPGPHLMFGSFDGSVHRWNFVSDAEASIFGIPHEQTSTSIALTADGRHLATGGWDAFAAVMDTGSAEMSQKLSVGPEGLRAGVIHISISPDGAWLATTEVVPLSRGSDDGPGEWLFGSVRMWRLRAPVEPFSASQNPWWAVGFDPSGAFLSARVERTVRFVRNGQSQASVAAAVNVWDPVVESQEKQDSVRALRVDDTFGREGDYVTVRFDHNPGVAIAGSISFSPSGQRAAFLSAEVNSDGTSLENPEIVLVDVGTGEVIQRKALSLAATRAFGPLEFVDDETVIASLIATLDTPDAQRGSLVWTWGVKSNSLELLVSLEDESIYDMAVSSANGMVALSDDFRSVVVLDLAGREIWRADADRRLANAPAQLAFSPDGETLFASSFAQLHRWEIFDGWREVQGSVDIEFKPHDIKVDPSSRLLVVADWNGILRFIDASSFEQLLTYETYIGPLLEVDISPDGRRIAVIGVGGRRLLGGILPSSVEEAERLSRLTVRGGALVRLSSEDVTSLVQKFPETNTVSRSSPEDAKFFGLLRSGGVSVEQPEKWVDWLFATEPFRITHDMNIWFEENSDHPFSSNILQWATGPQSPN